MGGGLFFLLGRIGANGGIVLSGIGKVDLGGPDSKMEDDDDILMIDDDAKSWGIFFG